MQETSWQLKEKRVQKLLLEPREFCAAKAQREMQKHQRQAPSRSAPLKANRHDQPEKSSRDGHSLETKKFVSSRISNIVPEENIVQPQPIEIQYSDLNFTVPIVASDGNIVMINDNGPTNLLFFQMRQKPGGTPSGDVVAAIRLHNIDELEALGKQIEEVVEQHRSRES